MSGLERLTEALMKERSRRPHLAIVARRQDVVTGFMWLSATKGGPDDMGETLAQSLSDMVTDPKGVVIHFKWMHCLADGFIMRSLMELLEADPKAVTPITLTHSMQRAMVATNSGQELFGEIDVGGLL